MNEMLRCLENQSGKGDLLLEFGVSLDKVCKGSVLHPGLRELLLKAYLSASGNDRAEEESFDRSSMDPNNVLKALRAGPKGQGRLMDRMSLKLKLESGKWIVATQTSPGAPLWLLRHFFGCLPQPLLNESQWVKIAVACRDVLRSKTSDRKNEIFDQISTALRDLPDENCSTLVALLILIRNLSLVKPRDTNFVAAKLHEETLEALSLYFTAAIISRPYRPGLYTKVDEEHKPLLFFLTENWLEIEKLCGHTGISCYRRLCETRYKFVSLDDGFDRTAFAEDNNDQISVQERLARKSNEQKSRIMKNDETAEIWKKESGTTMLKNKIHDDNSSLATVHTPNDVYFISPNAKYIHMSVNEEAASSSGVMTEDSCDNIKLSDTEFDPSCVQLRVPKMEGSLENESINNQNSDVRKSMSKCRGEVITFTGIDEVFHCDVTPTQKKVTDKVNVRINGTQTFECEFCEGSLTTKDEVRSTPSRVDIVKNVGTEELKGHNNASSAVKFGLANAFRISKMCKKKAVIIPLSKSTALLIKNLPSDVKIVHFPATKWTMSDFIDLISKGKVIDEAAQAITPREEAQLVKNTEEQFRTLTKGFGYQNNNNDFVSELKKNFRQGRKRPSDAKLSSQIMSAVQDDAVSSLKEMESIQRTDFVSSDEFIPQDTSVPKLSEIEEIK